MAWTTQPLAHFVGYLVRTVGGLFMVRAKVSALAGTYFGVLWSPMTRTQRWASGLYRPYPLVHKEGD